jgi:NADH-quinone oxidoreductase subunit A
MNPGLTYTPDLIRALIYLFGVIAVLGLMLGFSFILGQRHNDKATGEVFESGVRSTGTARMRFSVKFYLVGMLFVIFDLEAAVIFAWAVSARESGLSGYVGLLLFVVILIIGLIYEWKMGALDWVGIKKRQRMPVNRQEDAQLSAKYETKK